MKTYRSVLIVVVVCLAFLASPAMRAAENAGEPATAGASADLAGRMEELQKEIEHLQAELSTVKKQLSESKASTAASATPATAPAPAPSGGPAGFLASTNVTGFIDGYYGYNFNHPRVAVPSVLVGTPLTTPATSISGFRAFDAPSSQLAFNMAELTLSKTPDGANSRLGFNFTLGFGNAMNVVNSTDPGGLGFAQYVKEAYLSYLAPLGKGLQIDFGKFVTTNGAEVIETKDNWNYSRGLLFTYAIPFYHFGFRAKYAFSDKYSLTGLVVNGWNDIVDNNTGKTFGLSFGWNPNKKVSLAQNYYAGPEQPGNNDNWRQLTDTVVTYSPTSKLSLMANYDYGRGDRVAAFPKPVWWSGAAGYVRYAFNNRYALSTRYEYFNDHNGFTTGNAQHLNEFTGTFERLVATHLITRLEYRRDMSNRPSFAKGTMPIDKQDTVAAGLVYVFDLREGMK